MNDALASRAKGLANDCIVYFAHRMTDAETREAEAIFREFCDDAGDLFNRILEREQRGK